MQIKKYILFKKKNEKTKKEVVVSFYRLKYTNFINSDNYLVGLPYEINPESRFLALGARRGHVIADLNYSCFLARRASLFLFGSLVRRSHPAVSFGYRFYDYEDLFSEFSTLSLSYVRDWVPGLLTNYKALFRTALKEEGALRRIGFFFQFPDILLMFGANDSIGFIINEARSIQIPTIVTGDTSLSFSRITYMLLGNYKSLKSTMFFVKLFLDLNAESRRFRVLRHYSIFKHLIRSIFLRRTLKSKLFSIKLAKMFFVFKAISKLRVSQITPVVYRNYNWIPASFFRVLKKPVFYNRNKGSVMRKSLKGRMRRIVPISKKEYVTKRLNLLKPAGFAKKLRCKRLVLNRKFMPLTSRRLSFGNRKLHLNGRTLKRRVRRVTNLKLLKRGVGGSLGNLARSSKSRKFRRLLKIAKRRGLQTKLLLNRADIFLHNRLKLLNNPDKDYSAANPLPVFMFDRKALRHVFPFLGYFSYGYMAKRLNTLLFYRTIFRQIVQKRKRILRLKRFTSDLRVISVKAKKFRSLNLAVNRRISSISKLRARVKKFSKKLKELSRLKKFRRTLGFNEHSYTKRTLDDKKRSDLRKKNSNSKLDKTSDKGLVSGNKNSRLDVKFGQLGEHPDKKKSKVSKNNKFSNSKSSGPGEAEEDFSAFTDGLHKKGVKGSNLSKRPKLLEDLDKLNRKSYSLNKGVRLRPKKKKSKIFSKDVANVRLVAKFASASTSGRQRLLVLKNFTPTQRHILRVCRILFTRYPSFMAKSRLKRKKKSPRVATIPRTLYQFLLKERYRYAKAFFKRTGKRMKFSHSVRSQLPKQFWGPGRGGFKRGKGRKPWDKGKYKNSSNFNQISKKTGGKDKPWFKEGDGTKKPFNPNYRKKGRGGFSKNYFKGPKPDDGSSKRSDYNNRSRKPSSKDKKNNNNTSGNKPRDKDKK